MPHNTPRANPVRPYKSTVVIKPGPKKERPRPFLWGRPGLVVTAITHVEALVGVVAVHLVQTLVTILGYALVLAFFTWKIGNWFDN